MRDTRPPLLCRTILAVAAAIVPAAHRRDWRAEWNGELDYRWRHLSAVHETHTRAALAARCAGALLHAAWLRKESLQMHSFLQDVRFALRLARRDRAFAAVAVLTLALGIGANAALYTVVEGTLLQPLPFRDPQRLVLAWETLPAAGIDQNTPAPATYADWRARSRTLASLAAFTTAVLNVTGDGDPDRLLVLRTSAGLLPVLGIDPALGRPFRQEEDRAGGPRVVLLSDDLWTRRYARNPAIVGRTIQLGGAPAQVVGVLPRDLPMPLSNVDAWIPLALAPAEANSESRMLWVVGRLAPDATRAAAQAELSALLRSRSHAGEGEIGANVESIDHAVRGDVRGDLLLVFAATGIVLLIACLNVATMLLARGTARARELSVRVALGASRARVARQLLSESLVLAAAGGSAGALAAVWGVRLFRASLPPALASRFVARLDWRVLLFVMTVSLATTLLFGLLPIFGSFRRGAPGATSSSGRATDARGVRSMRGALVAVEVALAVVLVSSAVLLARTFTALVRADMGFSPDQVLTMDVPRADRPGAAAAARLEFYRTLVGRLEALPRVRAVGLTNGLPVRFTGGGSGFFPAGGTSGAVVRGNHRIVSGGYFAALGIPILSGRTFTEADREGAPPVAVVSRAFAERAWPGRSALGQRFTWGAPAQDNPPITVVGVAGDVRLARGVAPSPHVYLPWTEVPTYVTSEIALRVDGDPLSIAASAREAVRRIDPDQPVSVAPFDRLLADSVARRRLTLVLMLLFAAVAMLLSAVGLYGVVSFIVGRRTREIGVRLALGSSAAAMRWRVLQDGLTMAGVGAVAGIVLALAAGRWIRSVLPGAGTVDAAALATAVMVLLVSAAAACDIPARRASRIDPMTALRIE